MKKIKNFVIFIKKNFYKFLYKFNEDGIIEGIHYTPILLSSLILFFMLSLSIFNNIQTNKIMKQQKIYLGNLASEVQLEAFRFALLKNIDNLRLNNTLIQNKLITDINLFYLKKYNKLLEEIYLDENDSDLKKICSNIIDDFYKSTKTEIDLAIKIDIISDDQKKEMLVANSEIIKNKFSNYNIREYINLNDNHDKYVLIIIRSTNPKDSTIHVYRYIDDEITSVINNVIFENTDKYILFIINTVNLKSIYKNKNFNYLKYNNVKLNIIQSILLKDIADVNNILDYINEIKYNNEYTVLKVTLINKLWLIIIFIIWFIFIVLLNRYLIKYLKLTIDAMVHNKTIDILINKNINNLEEEIKIEKNILK